ncbi:MAG: hypothetical protein Q8O75_01135 [bacterium]|nr:hypothetical protein [bacterium]
MRSLNNRKKSSSVLRELLDRVLRGEELVKEEVIRDYINPNSPYSYLIAKSKVRGWFNYLKLVITQKHNLWFGSKSDGVYGILGTEGEFRKVQTAYYIRVKGIVKRAVRVKNEAVEKGFMIGSVKDEILALPKVSSGKAGK